MTEGIDFAFVIERGDSPVCEPLYYAPQTQEGWSKDHMVACRFSRPQDAQAVADAYGLADEYEIRIHQHGWS